MKLESNPNPSKANFVGMTNQTDYDILLSEHVRRALERYFSQINGYGADNLYAMVMAEVEKPVIETVLKHTGHNQTKAAKILGLSRSTLRKKMIAYGLE